MVVMSAMCIQMYSVSLEVVEGFGRFFMSLWDNYLCLLVIHILSVHCQIVRIPSLFDFRSPIVSQSSN